MSWTRGSLRLLLGVGLVSLASASADAWDRLGHEVVGAIAWSQLSEAARTRAVELMLLAPEDSDLPTLMSPGPRPRETRASEFFSRACYWADLVKDQARPERKERYDRFDWHFVNWFWTPTPEGPIALDGRARFGQLVRQLERLEQSVVNDSRSSRERALDLAWILHLVGDVHQPLHSSARVSRRDPDGDRGGNDFLLDDERAGNLHVLWDTILRRHYPREHREPYRKWVSRVAEDLKRSFPRAEFDRAAVSSRYEDWSWEGAQIAMHEAFPDSLERDGKPSADYERLVLSHARRLVPQAGYQLAALLERLFGTK